jgi:hypothetical protein
MISRPDRFFWALCASLLICVRPCESSAQTVFSNFGPGNTFNVGNANPVGFDFFTGDVDAQANSFVPLFGATLNSLTIALSSFNGTNSSPLTVSLAANAGTGPGSVFESWTIASGLLPSFGSPFVPLSFTSTLHSTLIAGTPYWVTVSGGGFDPSAWNLTVLADANPTATSVNGGASWNRLGATPGALRIEGTITTPEPSELALMTTGFVGLMVVVGRRRRTRG